MPRNSDDWRIEPLDGTQIRDRFDGGQTALDDFLRTHFSRLGEATSRPNVRRGEDRRAACPEVIPHRMLHATAIRTVLPLLMCTQS